MRDPVEGRGPLQGLSAGLAAIAPHARAAFVSSTDAPFLHPALVRRLAALRGDDYDVVVPRAGGHYHPLSAIYSCAVLPAIDALLAEDRLRLFSLFERVRTLVVDEALLLEGEELAAVDPGLRSLRNVNTPEELAAARVEHEGREGGSGR